LAQRYRVIVVDRPGLGYTDRIDPAGASLRQQADLIARAAAELGAKRPIVFGHSYGGAVALAWAVHRPDALSALVVSAAAIQSLGHRARGLLHDTFPPALPALRHPAPDCMGARPRGR
jgi:pimeloyl-ACP methyl ester carboxylesterase